MNSSHCLHNYTGKLTYVSALCPRPYMACLPKIFPWLTSRSCEQQLWFHVATTLLSKSLEFNNYT